MKTRIDDRGPFRELATVRELATIRDLATAS